MQKQITKAANEHHDRYLNLARRWPDFDVDGRDRRVERLNASIFAPRRRACAILVPLRPIASEGVGAVPAAA